MTWPGGILILIISLGLFLRTWQFESRLAFDFDNEFFAWEAKKILVDKKLTLIGQEASTGGVFIGPLYTYISTLAYALFDMDPVAGGVVAVIFGVVTAIALYSLGKSLG